MTSLEHKIKNMSLNSFVKLGTGELIIIIDNSSLTQLQLLSDQVENPVDKVLQFSHRQVVETVQTLIRLLLEHQCLYSILFQLHYLG